MEKGGIGILGMLGIAFVVLKLTGHINWSWWWVTCPFWSIPLLFILFIGGLLLWGASKIRENKRP